MKAAPCAHHPDPGPAVRRPSIVLQLPSGQPVMELHDPVVVQMVQNRELPPNRRDAPEDVMQRTRRMAGRALGAATLVYALWSVINYLAPRGSPDSGMPEHPPFDFDYL